MGGVVKCSDCGSIASIEDGMELSDDPCKQCELIANSITIRSVTEIRHCPSCGKQTEVEHGKHETKVTCPEHGRIMLN